MISGPLTASPQLSVSSVPLPRRIRSQSASGEFPPPMRRTSTDASGTTRPVPFAAKFQKVHPGTTGVTVLEHMERLDAVEASLKRLGMEDTFIEEDDEEEVDVGESSTKVVPKVEPVQPSNIATSPFTPPHSPLPTVPEVESLASSMAEEDLIALSKSTSHVEVITSPHRTRWSSRGRRHEQGRSLDWMHAEEDPAPKRTVIVEVCNYFILVTTLPDHRLSAWKQ